MYMRLQIMLRTIRPTTTVLIFGLSCSRWTSKGSSQQLIRRSLQQQLVQLLEKVIKVHRARNAVSAEATTHVAKCTRVKSQQRDVL
jgi:hypothetical protein